MKSPVPRYLALLVYGALTAALPRAARAQLGVGGAVGSVGALTDADIYVSFQKKEGSNLTDRDRSLFLNKANCECQADVWVKAVILPSASIKAAAISSSASVSMYVGNACDPTVSTSCCHRLASVPYSQFRLSGITVKTTVDLLVRQWSSSANGSCRDTLAPAWLPADAIAPVGTGGAGTGGAGTGGAGTGGVGGQGGQGEGGDTGTGGASASTGGASGTDAVIHGACYGQTFNQALNIFIGTLGDGSRDVVTKSLGFGVDSLPPNQPSNVTVSPVNEALQVRWTGLSTSEASDLFGYQALCSRGSATPVFKTGTFSASFDACSRTTGGWPPADSVLGQDAYVCSDVLPTSSTSVRVKILENDINYLVGVAAIDKERNASLVTPQQGRPILTKDFYYEYRHNDPQGTSPGGFCDISGVASGGLTALGAGLSGLLAWSALRRRSRRRP